MRRTIDLEGERRAVIQIPYEKLATTTVDKMKQTSQNVIVVSRCCKGRDNLDIQKMVSELEIAYEEDTKQLKNKISEVQRSRDESRQENAKLKIDLSSRDRNNEELSSTVELLRVACRQKDTEISKLIEQRDIIARNKISEFRQSEYRRWHEHEQLLRLKEVENKDLTAKVELLRLQKIRQEEESSQIRFKQRQTISRLTEEVNESVKRFSRESERINGEWRAKEEESERRIRALKESNQQLEAILKSSQVKQDLDKKEISRLSELLRTAEEKAVKQRGELEAALHEQSVLAAQVSNLGEKLSAGNLIISSLHEQKGKLLLEISDLRVELKQRERVCEVRIERVVDGKQRISELEKAVFELQLQLKQLSQQKEDLGQQIRRRQNLLGEANTTITKLQIELKTLKAYVEKREGSFKWTVQRQIEKDLVISERRPEAYKVYQVGEYSREKTRDNKRQMVERLANSFNQKLFSNQTEQIVITQERLFE